MGDYHHSSADSRECDLPFCIYIASYHVLLAVYLDVTQISFPSWNLQNDLNLNQDKNEQYRNACARLPHVDDLSRMSVWKQHQRELLRIAKAQDVPLISGGDGRPWELVHTVFWTVILIKFWMCGVLTFLC